MSDPAPSKRVDGDAILDDALTLELLRERLIGVFATLNRDGTIHAVPMWFASHDRSILLATGSGSAKVANLGYDSRSTLVIHDSRPGFEVCGVSMTGTAEIVRGKHAQGLIELVHRRYVTVAGERIPAVDEFLGSDDVALRFAPLQALTWDERESAACLALRARGEAYPLEPTTPR